VSFILQIKRDDLEIYFLLLSKKQKSWLKKTPQAGLLTPLGILHTCWFFDVLYHRGGRNNFHSIPA